MDDEFEKALADLGGKQLVDRFNARVLAEPAKELPRTSGHHGVQSHSELFS